jgi:hypothetical protein
MCPQEAWFHGVRSCIWRSSHRCITLMSYRCDIRKLDYTLCSKHELQLFNTGICQFCCLLNHCTAPSVNPTNPLYDLCRNEKRAYGMQASSIQFIPVMSSSMLEKTWLLLKLNYITMIALWVILIWLLIQCVYFTCHAAMSSDAIEPSLWKLVWFFDFPFKLLVSCRYSESRILLNLQKFRFWKPQLMLP